MVASPTAVVTWRTSWTRRSPAAKRPGIEVIIQDARDYQALSRILHELRPQVIIQLAAVSHAGRSNKDPFTTFDHSLRTLENALDSASGNIDHFIEELSTREESERLASSGVDHANE